MAPLSRCRCNRPNCTQMRPHTMSPIGHLRDSILILCLAAASCGTVAAAAAAGGSPAIIPLIDGSVAHRDDNLVSYTVTEHYRVYRGQDHAHPAAEMVVRTL